MAVPLTALRQSVEKLAAEIGSWRAGPDRKHLRLPAGGLGAADPHVIDKLLASGLALWMAFPGAKPAGGCDPRA